MHAVVQPIWEGLAVLAWCFLAGVIPDVQQPGPTREQIANEKAKDTFSELAASVGGHNPDRYLSHFTPELRKKFKARVEGVLLSPKKHNLAMNYKLEAVQIGSHEATYKAKILTEDICHTGYQDNIEYATVTLAPAAESGEGKFFSEPSNDPAEMRWEIIAWETEKVVPYDRNAD